MDWLEILINEMRKSTMKRLCLKHEQNKFGVQHTIEWIPLNKPNFPEV